METERKLSESLFEKFLMSFFLLMIIPFIILFLFNHPSADDFGLAVNTKLFGFLKAQINYYYTWTGKYFSNAVLSLSPLYFNSITGYKIFTLLLMLFFFYFLYKMIMEIAGSGFDNRHALLISLAVFFLYFYSMPSVAQSFYWLTASVVYQVGVLLIMLFVISFLRREKSDGWTKTFYAFISCLTLVMAIGSSEMAMTISVITAGLLLLRELLKKKKPSLFMIILLVIGAVACYVVVSAPGNKIREQMFPGNHQLFFSLGLSLTLFFKSLFAWMIMSPLIPVTVLMYPVLYKIAASSGRKFSFTVNPLLCLLIVFICVYGLLFIPVWSIGKTPYSRTQNIIYFVFLLGWFYTVISLISFLIKKGKLKDKRFPLYANVVMLCLILFFLVVKNNVRLAFTDVIRGTAIKYDIENNDRYDYIRNNANDSVSVEPIRTIPRSIFVSDVLPDGNDEFNKKFAEYFNKKFIVLKDSLQSKK